MRMFSHFSFLRVKKMKAMTCQGEAFSLYSLFLYIKN